MDNEFRVRAAVVQEGKPIYRNSRAMVQSQAVKEIRRGDLTGAKRGVFHAGLMACALGAQSAEESCPYLFKLVRETGDSGWLLAQAALEADSAPMLQALIETGQLGTSERVWSGYSKKEGELARDLTCEKAAVHAGAHRCLKYLVEIMPSVGLLSQAAVEGWPQTFELLLDRAVKLRASHEIDQALADLVVHESNAQDSGRMGVEALSLALIKAGARLNFLAGAPTEWVSWNGSTPKAMDWAWVPALRLCETEDELPPGSTLEGTMEGSAFFSQWSTGCRLVRSAIAAGAGKESSHVLMGLEGWELAVGPGSQLSPLALMAMANPTTTDSKLYRTVLDTNKIILDSKRLGEALADKGPMSLVKCAVGRWLWGGFGAVPVPSEVASWANKRLAISPLIEGLGDFCQRLCIRPLGVSGSCAAAQEFIGKMSKFESMEIKKGSLSWTMAESLFARSERIERERAQEEKLVSDEWRAAKSLSHFMETRAAAAFLDVVLSVHKSVTHADASERGAAKDKAILSVGLPAQSGKRMLRI